MSDNIATTVLGLVGQFNKATAERDAVRLQTASLDDKIYKLRQAIFGLSSLIEPESEFEKLKQDYPEIFDDYVDSRLGLTDAIRTVLKNAAAFMTPVEIKDEVAKISGALEGHKSAISSVHTVIKRLLDAKELTAAISDDGKTLYGWTADETAREKLAESLAPEDREDFLGKVWKSKGRIRRQRKGK